MCNDDAAELAMERWTRALRRHFRRRFTVSEVRTKFYEFKERYNTYTALTSNPSIWYDYETDEMHFPLAMREYMTAHFPMAPRYFVYTEPAYNNMLEIWGGGRRDNQFVPEESSNGPQLQQPPKGRNGEPDTPIIISESNTSVRDSRHSVGVGIRTYVRRINTVNNLAVCAPLLALDTFTMQDLVSVMWDHGQTI
ncbi:hypothetical protein Salat_2094600 [Sesamum alatum]|uniref:Uncharacterized protein n=1 Tax=Sesamum alatum TaxID=300844 RepID=A0AAE1Y0H6_9LAMI|nr:hypothetical protein Salat_2094600 [Sesamum alatum]